MGSSLEINDTLQLTYEQGFPEELQIEAFLKAPDQLSTQVIGKVYEFTKEDIRIFHPAPTRVFLVQNIDGKWLHWGHALILEQTINSESKTTSGKFKIIRIYSPEYMKLATMNEAPEGRGFGFGVRLKSDPHTY